MKTKKKFLPENVIELMFGVGASVVILGALLKITHSDLGPITGNLMLSIGLVTEAIIFAIAGIQGYLTGDSSVEDKGLQTIEAETQNLQSAVDQTVAGLSALNNNLTQAAKATSTIAVPKDIGENITNYNLNLSSAASKLNDINNLYDLLNKNLSEVNSSTEWNFHSKKSFSPTIFNNIDLTIKRKLNAMKEYKSELKKFPHPRSLEGIEYLAKYRGMQSGFNNAEAFTLVREFTS